MKLRIWISAALFAAIATPAAAQPRDIGRPGTVSHAAAAAHFPERVGDFQRSNVTQYDAAANNVSASYNLLRGGDRLLITVYVYPVAGVQAAPGSARTADVARAALCRQELRLVGQVVETQHRCARRIDEGVAPAVEGVGPGLNLRSVHSFTAPFNGREQEVRSETDLYCYVGGDWVVKYRATSNAGFDAVEAIEQFIRSGPWPGRNPPPAPDEVVSLPASSSRS
jgi:hypothetical protein